MKATIQKQIGDSDSQFLMHLKGPEMQAMITAYLEFLRVEFKYSEKYEAQKYWMKLYEFIDEHNLGDLFK